MAFKLPKVEYLVISTIRTKGLRGLAILALAAIPALATPIFVFNYSFETLPPGNLPNFCGPTCGSYSTGAIPGWVGTGAAFGQFQPGSGAFTSLSDGPTSAYSNGGTITQQLSQTVQLGEVYMLQVALGYRLDTPFAGSAALLIGTTPFLATGTQPTRGTFGNYTAMYTGTSADVGKSITIELLASGAQGNFDNVRLDGMPATPEPVSYLLIGSALLLLMGLKRRQNTQNWA